MSEILAMGEMLVEIMRPRAGMPLHRTAEFLGPFPSGAPAIFIDTVARLGHAAEVIGGVGRDDFGACILTRLRDDGVTTRFVLEVPDRSTAVAFVTYDTDGSRSFIFHIDGTPAVMARFPAELLKDPPVFFHVMGCSLMANDAFRESIFDAVRLLHERGTKISFDPNIRPELLVGRDLRELVGPVLERCAVLLPGTSELRLLAGAEDVEDSVKSLFSNPRLESVVLKKGVQGAAVYTRDGHVEVPAYKVQEADPTGAGDSFDAGFLCGLLEGRTPADSARMAAAAGALNAASFGPMEGKISADSVRRLVAGQ